MNKNKHKCESCHQKFNWWDLLWDLDENREVCVNCFHAPIFSMIDKKAEEMVGNFQSGDIYYGRGRL